jgi:tRNA(His) 5'-end guanylyltransferase
MGNDNLGDYLKAFEARTTEAKIDAHRYYIYARMDGRAFHTLCRGLGKPYSPEFVQVMKDVTMELCNEFSPAIAYVQSDEISLLWLPLTNEASEFQFGGKIHKLLSVLPSFASAAFTTLYQARFFKYPQQIPSFDCRICELPLKEDARKMFWWRMRDAYKNAIGSIAQSQFSDKELHGMNTDARILMLTSKGTQLSDETLYNPSFLYGTAFVRETVTRPPKPEEVSTIPVEHIPDLITRAEYRQSSLPAKALDDVPFLAEEATVDTDI